MSLPKNPTAQQIFDHVLTHLRKQGHAAVRHSGGCVYRATDGSSCAVGCLIPNDAYRECMEGISMLGLIEARDNYSEYEPRDVSSEGVLELAAVMQDLGLYEHLSLLAELQMAHDKILALSGMRDWEMEMQNIAKYYSLRYTKPTLEVQE